MARTNLFYNPTMYFGTDNYLGVNGAVLTTSNDYGFYGENSLKITKSSSNNCGFISTTPISVVVGLPYALSAYILIPSEIDDLVPTEVVIRAEWRNSVGTIIQVDQSEAAIIRDDSSWHRISGVWNAPVGATVLYVQLVQPLAEDGDSVAYYVDAVLVEQSGYVGGFVYNISQGQENAAVNKALGASPAWKIEGLNLNADVSINDLTLNTIDEFGTIWICTGLQGWWVHAAPEAPDIPRGTEDGSYDVSGRYQARYITLTGSFFPPNSDSALSAARDRLVAATDLVRRGGWLRTYEEPTKAAYVRLSGQPQIETVNAKGRTDFSIGFKAGDPIKYKWDDGDPDGYSHTQILAADDDGIVTNDGTAMVTALFSITGPAGAGTTIYNSLTDESMTLVESLRGAAAVGEVATTAVTDNIATLTTTAPHHLIIGDIIGIVGVGAPFDSIGVTYTVVAASDELPYTVSFALTSDDLPETPTFGGQILLEEDDVLTIDTYNKSITFNGTSIGHRVKLETLTDWIKIAPGENIIEFHDDIDTVTVISKKVQSSIATLVTEDTHYLIPGEEVSVNLGETATLSKKSLTSNIVTLTTVDPHGFAVGDELAVESIESAVVNAKQASTTVATLTTVDASGISATDSVTVALPVTAIPANKALTSNVATITTQVAHGFSVGDGITVALPYVTNILNKNVTSNVATLTSDGAHGFSVGDSITVALSDGAIITNKAHVGSQAILTTSGAHGFSQGDSVTIALPTSATLADSRSIDADTYLVTLNTSGAHNFSVGDKVTVNVGLTSTKTVTNRAATSTHCTLTLGSHSFSVGERITVTSVTSRYNGTFYITGVTGTTITYANSGATEGTTAASGSVLNVTIASYYNGSGKIIETIPSSTSFTYLEYNQAVDTTSTAAGTSPTLTNTTNTGFNGTKTLVTVSSTQFTYNY